MFWLIDILKKHYVLIRNVQLSLEKQDSKSIWGRYLISSTNEKTNEKQKQNCEPQMNSIKISNDTHTFWRREFHKVILSFRMCADSEDDNEIGKPIVGYKKKTNHKPKHVYHVYYIIKELNNVLQSG